MSQPQPASSMTNRTASDYTMCVDAFKVCLESYLVYMISLRRNSSWSSFEWYRDHGPFVFDYGHLPLLPYRNMGKILGGNHLFDGNVDKPSEKIFIILKDV
jgi:hypothetical protein